MGPARLSEITQMLNELRDWVWKIDVKGRIVYSNDRVRRLVGYTPGEITGRSLFDLIPSLRKTEAHQQFQSWIADPRPVDHLEHVVRHRSGRVVLLEACLSPLYDADGHLTGFCGSDRDITGPLRKVRDFKRSQLLMDREMTLFESFFRFIPYNMYIKDLRSRFLRINRCMADTFGLSSESLAVSKTDFDFFTNEHALQAYTDEQEIIRTGRPMIGYEEKETWSDGHVSWCCSTKMPMRNEQGVVIGLAGISFDISELKQAERERLLLIQDLESKNSELERFTYSASHDLKSPLITIVGFIGRLRKHLGAEVGERPQKDMDRIERAARKMQQLLDDLLELSRVGRLVSPPTDESMESIVREALEAIDGQLMGSGCEVSVEDRLPRVQVDRARMVEVLQNLLDNAVKYSAEQGAEGRPEVRVGARREGADVIFYVKDNGCGVEAAYLETVFGLFNQLDPGRGGTGIGLALVRRIIEFHKGRIWMESDGLGKGCTVCFTIGTGGRK